MRCHDQVRDVSRKQRVAVHGRFFGQHVDGCTAEASTAQRVGQRRRVDQRPARGVDQHRVHLHAREPRCVDQALRRRRQRAMQAQHVHHGQKLVQVHAARLPLAAGTIRDQHLHAEGGRRVRDAAAERAVAHDAERAAGEFADREIEQAELLAALPRP